MGDIVVTIWVFFMAFQQGDMKGMAYDNFTACMEEQGTILKHKDFASEKILGMSDCLEVPIRLVLP